MNAYDKNLAVVFDLDDTLYKEIDYLYSAYREIAFLAAPRQEEAFQLMKACYEKGENAFEAVIQKFGLQTDVKALLNIYRNHVPAINLSADAEAFLSSLQQKDCVIGLITDGREVTQMHKVEALGLSAYIAKDDIVISESFGSEKPSERNYRYFMDRYPNARYCYVGDNVKKDFVTPNRLGWMTIRLRDTAGRNIHLNAAPSEDGYEAQYVVDKLDEITIIE